MKLRGLLATLVGISSLWLSATPARAAGAITIKGSDTMVILGQRWAEDYMKKNPSTVIQVTGGGSGTGISALINGTTDICASSRAMKPAEKEKVRDRYNNSGIEIPVARDGLAVYVSATNALTEISIPDLKGIFTGKITNWKEVGGKDLPIVVYSDATTCGTRAMVKKVVMGGADYGPSIKAQTSVKRAAELVGGDDAGVAGVGKGFVEAGKMKIVDSKKIERPLGLVTVGAPNPASKAVIDAFSREAKSL